MKLWPDKRQLRRIRRKRNLRVTETATSVIVHFSDPGREVRSASDLTMTLNTGWKVRLAAIRRGMETYNYSRAMFGHGQMVADDGTIVEF